MFPDWFLNWIENHQLPCLYKQFLGVDCPGCGMQRSIVALLKGEIVESFFLFPALLPIIVMILTLVAHLYYKFSIGAQILKGLFILNVLIVILSYIYKMYNFHCTLSCIYL